MNHASFDFTDSVVLITGGNIGLAMTRAFLDAGATVAVTGRRKDRLEQALEGYPAERTPAIPADVSDGAQVAGLVRPVVDRFGRLDVVVSNAAEYATGPVTELSDHHRLRSFPCPGLGRARRAARRRGARVHADRPDRRCRAGRAVAGAVPQPDRPKPSRPTGGRRSPGSLPGQ
jgi:hypothetical protein